MDPHEKLERELMLLASKKPFDLVGEIADNSVSVECGFDAYHDKADGIRSGLKGGKKDLFSVEYQGHAYIFFFIGTFKEIKAKIEKLPNKLTLAEQEAFVKKVEKKFKCRFAQFESPDVNECQLVFDASDMKGMMFDGVKLTIMIDPKRQHKPIKKKK